MQVEKSKRIQTSEVTFKISFLVESHALETEEMPNSTPPEEVLKSIEDRVRRWQDEMAEENLAKIDKLLEKPIIIKE